MRPVGALCCVPRLAGLFGRGCFNVLRGYATQQQVPNCNFTWTAALEIYLQTIVRKYDALTVKLSDPLVLASSNAKTISQEIKQLEPVITIHKEILQKEKELLEVSALLIEDGSFKELAEGDLESYRHEINDLQVELVKRLLPANQVDIGDAVLEVRAGTGGVEASLFAAEVFAMYQRFAQFRGWSFEVLGRSYSGSGGLKEASAAVCGSDVFGAMKNETGVHRVQRIPSTDSQGRVHTSTVTVAVLPQSKQVKVAIDPLELKVDTFRSSGPGGQHANKTESAVRMTHLPSGLVVRVEEDRSQLKNRAKALKLLSAKLADREHRAAMASQSSARRSQIGSGDRSERIRTYNFMQDRITDHRLGLSATGIRDFLHGEEALDSIVEQLRRHSNMTAVASLAEQELLPRLK